MEIYMSGFFPQLISSLVTACFTATGGVLILVLGQIALRFFVEPIHKQAEIIGEIADSLTYYANIGSPISPNEEMRQEELSEVKEAIKNTRRQASQLRATAWTIKWYGLWHLLGLVPSRQDVLDASSAMIGFSNSIRAGRTGEHSNRVKQLLNFD
jgi:hypothetical protein